MEKTKVIDIVVATYNGENYIREQIESIVSCTDFDKFINKIIISDDNSKDKTVNIINELQLTYPMIELLGLTNSQLGPRLNFNRAISATTAPYVMMADQDDYWLAQKITLSFERIRQLEQGEKGVIPALVFTDVSVTDSALKEIASSNRDYITEPINWIKKLQQLMIENVALGCTMIVNRRLLEIAMPIPVKSSMHDWWLILVARVFGEVSYIKEPTMLYRQHSNNVIGIGRAHKIKNPIVRQYSRLNDYTEKILGCSEQINTLCNRYSNISDYLKRDEYLVVSQFSKIADFPLIKRIFFLLKSGVGPSTKKRKVMFIICILFMPLLK